MTNNRSFLDGENINKKINEILKCFIMRTLKNIILLGEQFDKNDLLSKKDQKYYLGGNGGYGGGSGTYTFCWVYGPGCHCGPQLAEFSCPGTNTELCEKECLATVEVVYGVDGCCKCTIA